MNLLFLLFAPLLLALDLDAPQSTEPCGSGPTFWCASVPNAEECNATEFCRTYCWEPSSLTKDLMKSYLRKMNAYPLKSFLRLCFPDKKRQLAPIARSPDSMLCDECKKDIAELDSVLKDKSAIESVMVAMRFFCNLMPVYSTQCRNIVTDLFDMIDKLEPYLARRDPEKFCAELHVCPSGTYDLQEHTPITQFLHKYYTGDMNVTVQDNSLCDECRDAINSARAQLEDPAQQQNIMDTFHDFCSYFGPLKTPCTDYVNSYVPQLLQMMITYLSDAQGVCSRMGFCIVETRRVEENIVDDYN